jgi:hypothetical protein
MNNCSSTLEYNKKIGRQHEINQCLLRNASDQYIKTIHILVDSSYTREYYSKLTEMYKDKITFVEHGKQPTYSDLLRYISRTFPDNETICIMNSDIFFNSQKDHDLIIKIVKPMRLISLTRHEFTDINHSVCNEKTCPFTIHGGSSDVFIFQTPVPKNFNYDFVNHKQNTFGGEGVFHKAWYNCGYEICNPCDDIITVHFHSQRIHFHKYETLDTSDTNHMPNLKTKYPTD